MIPKLQITLITQRNKAKVVMGEELISSQVFDYGEREKVETKAQVFGSHNLLGFCQLVDVNYGLIS